MREILFRGKTDKGEWVQGSLIKRNIGCFIVDENNKCALRKASEHLFDFESNIVISKTIGQYTGLTDKNGTKIFEGDILQFDYIGKNLGVKGKAAVVFENGKFGVLWGWHKELVALDGFANTTLEVIGNIHDNPEVLKGCEGK